MLLYAKAFGAVLLPTIDVLHVCA